MIDSETKGEYRKENPIQFITDSFKSSLCDYSHAYILAKGDVAVAGRNENTKLPFKNFTQFKTFWIEIKCLCWWGKLHLHCNANIKFNWIKIKRYYSDTSWGLWQFKRNKIDNNANANANHSSSFRYKSDLIRNVAADGTVKNVTILGDH